MTIADRFADQFLLASLMLIIRPDLGYRGAASDAAILLSDGDEGRDIRRMYANHSSALAQEVEMPDSMRLARQSVAALLRAKDAA